MDRKSIGSIKQFSGNGQDPDAPNDPSNGKYGDYGVKIHGKGSISGGSKPTPQAAIMKRGNARPGSSAPRHAQKLRG